MDSSQASPWGGAANHFIASAPPRRSCHQDLPFGLRSKGLYFHWMRPSVPQMTFMDSQPDVKYSFAQVSLSSRIIIKFCDVSSFNFIFLTTFQQLSRMVSRYIEFMLKFIYGTRLRFCLLERQRKLVHLTPTSELIRRCALVLTAF